MKRILSAIIFSCVLINCVITPDVCLAGGSMSGQVVGLPTAVAEVLAPLTILEGIFRGDVPLSTAWKPASQSSNRQEVPQDTLLPGSPISKKMRKTCRHTAGHDVPGAMLRAYPYLSVPPMLTAIILRRLEHEDVHLVLLDYLVRLAESNLPDPVVSGCAFIPAQSRVAGLGFFIGDGGFSL